MKISKLNYFSLIFICIIAFTYALPNLFKSFQFQNKNSFLPGKTVNLGLDLKVAHIFC